MCPNLKYELPKIVLISLIVSLVVGVLRWYYGIIVFTTLVILILVAWSWIENHTFNPFHKDHLRSPPER